MITWFNNQVEDWRRKISWITRYRTVNEAGKCASWWYTKILYGRRNSKQMNEFHLGIPTNSYSGMNVILLVSSFIHWNSSENEKGAWRGDMREVRRILVGVTTIWPNLADGTRELTFPVIAERNYNAVTCLWEGPLAENDCSSMFRTEILKEM